MSIVGNSFGDPDYRKISTNLFEYDGKNVSERILYAVGIYLQSINDYKGSEDIQPDQVSCLYSSSLSKFKDKGWPDGHVLSWCLENAWNDTVTQENAEKYKPILF